ncbi:MAG: hypothetical protein A4S09_14180 [Proteobacteria bacterium SG_bin7]|nr:MAG: hypothetical protein A4S09_14180 [Proteobacteria bacterium SG_bin7]
MLYSEIRLKRGSEMGLHQKFNSAKNNIKRFNAESIILHSMRINRNLSNLPPDKFEGYMPWEIMLLIKWTLVFGNWENKKNPNQSQYNSMINKIKEVFPENKFLLKKSSAGIRKFMRQTAFQQFGLQRKLTKANVGRNFELFGSAQSGYNFGSKFKELAGLEIPEFIELCLLLWVYYSTEQKNLHLNKTWFNLPGGVFGQSAIDSFLELLSLDLDGAKQLAIKQFEEQSLESEIFEESPFRRKPLFRHGKNYYTYSPSLLTGSLDTFIYDFLKENDPEKFGDAFGPTFERYLNKILTYYKVKFYPETEIKKKVAPSNPVDFLISSPNTTILIEGKAIELSKISKVNPENGILVNALKDSAIKGVYQANKTAKALLNKTELDGNPIGKEFFALIVSYKELYLGTGGDVWNEFIKEGLEKKFNFDCQNDLVIDPDKIFFVSVEDFEILFRATNGNVETMISILRKAEAENKTPGEGKFIFGMHLAPYKDGMEELPPFLDTHTERIFQKLIDSYLKPKKQLSLGPNSNS